LSQDRGATGLFFAMLTWQQRESRKDAVKFVCLLPVLKGKCHEMNIFVEGLGPVLLATAAQLGKRQERGTRDKPSQ
jgi:hypothetical protein